MAEENHYSDEVLGDLTEEELAALNDPDGSGIEEGEDDDESIAEEGDDSATAGDDAGTQEGEDAASASDDGSAPSAESDEAANVDTNSAPLYTAKAPEGVEQQLADIQAQKDTLTDKFDSGEMSAKDFMTQSDVLNRTERELERAVERAKLAEDMARQSERNSWHEAHQEFMADNPQYSQNEIMRETFNATFRVVAQRPEYQNLPVTRANSMKLLRAAHDELRNVMGLKPQQDTDTAPEKVKSAKAPELPPTLAHVPASDINDTSAGRWAALERLRDVDPDAFENKYAAMSDAERDAYLRGQ